MDLLLGDPKRLPHPVQGIGALAAMLEAPSRRLAHPVSAGCMALVAVLLLTGSAAALLTRLPLGLGLLAAVYLAWSGLALGSLIREGEEALGALRRAKRNPALLPDARRAVQMLVSRDTSAMPLSGLYRSLGESISENLTDAFIAPYFWLCLGGPVGLWLYKAASTMDSMWGYTNERWRCLGRCAARLDDVLAFLPARLSPLFLLAAAWLRALPRTFGALRALVQSSGLRGLFTVPNWPGLARIAFEARLSASPNAGWPMAAAAWLLTGKCGGPTVYDGRVVDKPVMGPEHGLWEEETVAALLRHVRLAGIVGALSLSCAFAALRALL